jgi:hypothetical protein
VELLGPVAAEARRQPALPQRYLDELEQRTPPLG